MAKKVYVNPVFRDIIRMKPNRVTVIGGRGLSKTSILHSRRILDEAKEMPGAKKMFIGGTYKFLMTQVFPSLVGGFKIWGLEEERDYYVGRYAPKSKRWDKPSEPPLNAENFIHFRNGYGIHLISQDRPGSSNGINAQSISADEVKYINWDKIKDESLPALRAMRQFEHKWCYRSWTFTTSMPDISNERWALDHAKAHKDDVLSILNDLSLKIQELLIERSIHEVDSMEWKTLTYKINHWKKLALPAQKAAHYYKEASSLVNINVLGLEYIMDLYHSLDEYKFEKEVLSRRPDSIEGGFYPKFDSKRHTYFDSNNHHLIKDVGFDAKKLAANTCRFDGDIHPGAQLCITIDWGSHINCMWVFQVIRSENEIRFLKCLHVESPLILDDLVKSFADYYAPYNRKRKVKIVYGHDGNTHHANSQLTFIEQFIKGLRQHNWGIDLERPSVVTHNDRYHKINDLLSDTIIRTAINKENCENGIQSILYAPAKDTPKGIAKDKSSEKPSNSTPQYHATHYTDAFDQAMLYASRTLRSRTAGSLPSAAR